MHNSTAVDARQHRYGIVTYPQLRACTTYATLRLFNVIAMHADKRGTCWPSMATLISESGLSRGCTYKTLAKLIELGLIRRDANHRVLFIQDAPHKSPLGDSRDASKSPLGDSKSPHGDSLPYMNIPMNNDGGTMAHPKITNVQRAGARWDSPSVTPSKPTNIADRRLQRPADLASTPRACLEHIRKLSGVDIADAYRFNDARTLPEWIALIDEAWALRDTVLRSSEYPEFNAGKVINYAKYRAKYRSKLSLQQRASTFVFDHDADILSALSQDDEQLRFGMLQNIVMHGVSRDKLQGRIPESELSQLFPMAADREAHYGSTHS